MAVALLAFLVLAGCDALEPDCKVTPWVEARDTTVAAYDTVRIQAKSKDACGGAVRYLWSFDGGETYDTTTTAFLLRVFTRDDLGENKLRIRSLTDRGIVSIATNITITVEERRFAYDLPMDTVHFFADTVVSVDLSPATPIAGIAGYCWSLSAYERCTDSSLTPVVQIPLPRSLHSIQRLIAEVRLAGGARSETTSVVLHGRPRILGTQDDFSYRAELLGETSLRILLPTRQEDGARNPHNGQKVVNPRFMEMDFDGKVLQDRVYRSPREIQVASLSVHAGGTALILGRDDIVPNRDDLLVAAVDRAGGVTWEKIIDVDTSFIQPIRAFNGPGGNYQAIVTGNATLSSMDGKPPKRWLTRFHFLELGAAGQVLAHNKALVPDYFSLPMLAERMQDGSFILAGQRQDTTNVDRQDLWVLNFDFSGQMLWSKVFRSEVGPSAARSLEVLEDGSIYLTGVDYGTSLSHWILTLDGKGNQKDYRVRVFPKGYATYDMARSAQGTVLHLLNGDAGGLLLASDLAGNEKWQRKLTKGNNNREAYVESAVALPDGGFMVFGKLNPGRLASSEGEILVFRISADGKFLW